MAVLGGVSCGGNVCLRRQQSPGLFNFHNPNGRPCSFMASNPQSSKPRTSTKKISMSKVSLQPLPKQQEKKRNELVYEKIDEWMRDSVAEIVKKLPESPLLVHVYSDDNTTRTRTEKADENNWVSVKQKWEKAETPMPDGVIFVEQIEGDDEESDGKEEVSRAWGIVVQGQGCGLAPACYLLKTSKVSSGIGMTPVCLPMRTSTEEEVVVVNQAWILIEMVVFNHYCEALRIQALHKRSDGVGASLGY
ncbi:hypothetical protein GOBAR_AA30002 [Gossypium barbadense]|uniref:DUF7804 domain-containing protein n=1 Tax=Gossypium barbadense TaxID=3634 RepID=A0A2P5WHX8_GOSBA|nr:hypothetical protein GOBAR_AA30002 [Gossypium barbadense]